MPKLREYVQDAGHDKAFTSYKHTATAPTQGAQYTREQPLKSKLDATPGQQTRQVRRFISPQTALNNQ